jgi:hypothetical protein
MYASLDRIDIVTQSVTQRDGREEYWQTDHRDAQEIEKQRALSTLFALTRILNPRRGVPSGQPAPVMVYSAMYPPPEFLLQALRAAGALLTLGDDLDPKPIPGPATESRERGSFLGRTIGAARGLLGGAADRKDEGTPSLDDIIQNAFTSLAREVAAEHGVPMTLAGLQTVEDALAATAGSADEDEAAYWSAVFKLGAFAGELIRTSNGGRWVQVETGSLPFALSTTYRGAEATMNPLGKAIKRFAEGEGESVVALVRVAQTP